MIYWVLIISLILMVVILGFTTINLMKKLEKIEEIYEEEDKTQQKILLGYSDYINKISKIIEISDLKIKAADVRGSFKSDDEVGYIYKVIQEIQNMLNEFKVEKEEK